MMNNFNVRKSFRISTFFVALFFFFSCSKKNDIINPLEKLSNAELLTYFKSTLSENKIFKNIYELDKSINNINSEINLDLSDDQINEFEASFKNSVSNSDMITLFSKIGIKRSNKLVILLEQKKNLYIHLIQENKDLIRLTKLEFIELLMHSNIKLENYNSSTNFVGERGVRSLATDCVKDYTQDMYNCDADFAGNVGLAVFGTIGIAMVSGGVTAPASGFLISAGVSIAYATHIRCAKRVVSDYRRCRGYEL